MTSPGLRRTAATIAIACAGALLGAGCVVVPAYGPDGGDVVGVAPPAAQVEYYGVAPAPGYIWFGGYWNWYGGRHAWVPGYWGAGRAGHVWVPHAWGRHGNGWRLNQGHWR